MGTVHVHTQTISVQTFSFDDYIQIIILPNLYTL